MAESRFISPRRGSDEGRDEVRRTEDNVSFDGSNDMVASNSKCWLDPFFDFVFLLFFFGLKPSNIFKIFVLAQLELHKWQE